MRELGDELAFMPSETALKKSRGVSNEKVR